MLFSSRVRVTVRVSFSVWLVVGLTTFRCHCHISPKLLVRIGGGGAFVDGSLAGGKSKLEAVSLVARQVPLSTVRRTEWRCNDVEDFATRNRYASGLRAAY